MPIPQRLFLAASLAAVLFAPPLCAASGAKQVPLTPDVERAQAERPLTAARARYPEYFARAYARYPDLPRGVLEALAYAETGWRNVEPEASESDHERHMPPAYGIMGLYHGQGFADQVTEGAKLLGLSPTLVMRDPETSILAAAALLDRASKANRAQGLAHARADDPSSMAGVLARYAGYGEGGGEIRTYARQSFAYAVLSTLDRGVDANGVKVPKRAVNMERAFTATQLAKLRAPLLNVDPLRDEVRTPAATHATLAVDFGEALWVPAYSRNYSTAANAMTAVIMHTMEGSYAGSIAWFQNPNAVVSAHYLIRKSDGQITQMVREYHTAYHAKYHNNYTIGIEHDGYASDPGNWSSAMVNASARLTTSICARRGVNCASAWQGPGYDYWYVVPDSVRVKGHGMLTQNSNRYDPGKYFPWASYYSLINGGAPPNPNPGTKYWVDTFANATGYKWPSTLTPVGTLYQGTNYVYCKAWGERVGNATSYNHYWLKTDLDVGPAGAWVSAYYLSRWGNDEARDNNGTVIPNC
ncbi:MAG TPA: peptidoglycan recognition family protein [Luteimonas sp.]|nr:peptidoglycan recognition family protein [Luteimonas sp.]